MLLHCTAAMSPNNAVSFCTMLEVCCWAKRTLFSLKRMEYSALEQVLFPNHLLSYVHCSHWNIILSRTKTTHSAAFSSRDKWIVIFPFSLRAPTKKVVLKVKKRLNQAVPFILYCKITLWRDCLYFVEKSITIDFLALTENMLIFTVFFCNQNELEWW